MSRPTGGSPGATAVVLIHGGLWEAMDADEFWGRTGVVRGLERRGLAVDAPDRRQLAPDWRSEVRHLVDRLPDGPVVVIAGSNGCTAAVRLAEAHPGVVERLVLAWPATACEPSVDERARARLQEAGASPATIADLLSGETLRGITDAALAGLTMPVGVLPSDPENRLHQRRTVDALLRVLPHAELLPGCPEPPSPAFPSHLEACVASLAAFARLA